MLKHEHLPECHLWLEPTLSEQDWCTCDKLQACEQRVMNSAVQRVIELPGLLDAGFTYSGLLHREAVMDALRKGNND